MPPPEQAVNFYHIPAVKYTLEVVSTTSHSILFAVTSQIDPRGPFQHLEWLFFLWLLSPIMNEMLEFIELGPLPYFSQVRGAGLAACLVALPCLALPHLALPFALPRLASTPRLA